MCYNDSTGIGKFCRYGILWNEKNVFTADRSVTFLIITEINYPSWYFNRTYWYSLPSVIFRKNMRSLPII